MVFKKIRDHKYAVLAVGLSILGIFGVVNLTDVGNVDYVDTVPDYLEEGSIDSSLYVYRDYVVYGDLDSDIVIKNDRKLSGSGDEIEGILRKHLEGTQTYLPNVIGGDEGKSLDTYFEGVSDRYTDDLAYDEVYVGWEERVSDVEDVLGVSLGELEVIEEEIEVSESLFETLKNFDDTFVDRVDSLYPALFSVSVSDRSEDGKVKVTLLGSWLE